MSVPRILHAALWVGLAVFVLPPGASPATGSVVVEQITAENAEQRLLGGTDAIGGIGDWYLANDIVEFIVDDPSRAHAKSNHGGTLIDAGLVDRTGEDQFARLFPVVNLGQRVSLGLDRIRAERDPGGGWARLVAENDGGLDVVAIGQSFFDTVNPTVPAPGSLSRVHAQTVYTVRPGEPFVHIDTTFRNDGDADAPLFFYGDIWMRGGRAMRAFVGNTFDPDRSAGFRHRSFDPATAITSGAMSPFTFVSVLGMRQYPPIGYALFSPERNDRGLVSFGVTSTHVSVAGAFAGDPEWRKVGLAEMFEGTRAALAPGESWTYRRRLLVTGHPDAASTTDVIFPLLGFADGDNGVAGRVEPRNAPCSILVETALEGWPVTQILTRTSGPEAGRYRAVLPPGSYRLTLQMPYRESRVAEITVGPEGFAEVPTQRFEELAWLVFPRPTRDGGPARVIVRGMQGTPDPVFEPEMLGFTIDGVPARSGTETNEIHFVGNGSDPARVAIAPGRYLLTATRGFEYEIQHQKVSIPGPGREVDVAPFHLRRIASLHDWVSADLHVHAQASDDTGISNVTRLRSFAADDIDVMVSTDHDHLADFSAAYAALGLRDRPRYVGGAEVTSSAPNEQAPWTLGHNNAWPIEYRPLAHRKGAPPTQHMKIADLYGMLRRDYGAEVVQLNHPRTGNGKLDEGSFFTHLGAAGEPFDPSLPVTAWPNELLLETAGDGRTRGVDFDAVELGNGKGRRQYLRVREDWHSLLRQGFRSTATANSDSHAPLQIAGYPRNYVGIAGGLGGWSLSAFNRSVLGGRVFGTNGPLITRFAVEGAEMGETATARDGVVGVEIGVVAAAWVPVDEVRLLVNGEVVRRFGDFPSSAGEGLRVVESVELPLERDAFLTLEAGAPLDANDLVWAEEHPGAYTQIVAPGFVPTAFSNPVFVDADGNGRYEPPGLATESSPTLFLVAAAALVILGVAWVRRTRAAG